MMDLIVAPSGVVTAIYAEAIDLRSLGTTTITRASHVEPDETGQWFAQIIDGPTVGAICQTQRSAGGRGRPG